MYMFWKWYINWIGRKCGAWFPETQQRYSQGARAPTTQCYFQGSQRHKLAVEIQSSTKWSWSYDVKSPLFLSVFQAQLSSFPVGISDPVHKLHLHWLPKGKGVEEVGEGNGEINGGGKRLNFGWWAQEADDVL